MTATVYNGVLQGNATTHTQTLYTNNTGKNVRIIFNYFETGNTHPADTEFYFGPSSSPQHQNGQNLDTIVLSVPAGLKAGKNFAFNKTGNSTGQNAYGSYASYFPMEMALAEGSKITVKIPAQIDVHVNGFIYNFLVITEN